MEGMASYTQAAVERAMKVQEVILRSMAKKITWWQAAETISSRPWTFRYGPDDCFPGERGDLPLPVQCVSVRAKGSSTARAPLHRVIAVTKKSRQARTARMIRQLRSLGYRVKLENSHSSNPIAR